MQMSIHESINLPDLVTEPTRRWIHENEREEESGFMDFNVCHNQFLTSISKNIHPSTHGIKSLRAPRIRRLQESASLRMQSHA